ncbi:GNAT family N-acetyltransferase [Fusobacterium ulcerans]|jgi:ribosomal protein S18 acetylase RimI-like enzyme|uniref:GNAT family N-acetyltransferase n=1 Tax=Fusobacterium ulcerans TaxID=861 RepID=UPI000E4D5281|nr:GNAT family N-acetyltransferase [Fusobacterium ulcerans]RGY63953.1 GNAT family N-acetyltransferase [Fusobacterium ulcerans]
MEIYKSSINDKENFIKMRVSLFKELGEIDETSEIEELIKETGNYYTNHIDKDLFCWFAEIDGKIAAVASMYIFCRIPYFQNPVGLEGYILNVYTLPEFRNKGAASKLITEIIAFSKNSAIKKLWLNSSEAGKEIYKSLGFKENDNEMELFL